MTSNEIAIVGIACRFPGANNISEFWSNLQAGVESIRSFTEEELAEALQNASDVNGDSYIKAKGVIDKGMQFDAAFFKYNPYDAKLMDPQHRILLQIAYHALEDAGLVPDHYSGQIGTFVSAGFNTYLLHTLAARPELLHPQNHYQLAIANGNDFLATRIAYKLNLTGPAQTIQTACSSSLVAIHAACQSLLNYECDASIAGGVCITYPLHSGYIYKKDGIGSPDGHCRPFDSKAAGTVPGNGAGVVVLKRLEDAIHDSDHIYAVIKGSAINNDGNTKISYTAPSIQGQELVIRSAQTFANVSPESITYIETHGTGTSLGDPIEIEALTRAFTTENMRVQSCSLGALKANIGHLDAAAGVAGFIKTALMIYHATLPPQINFTEANHRIAFKKSPFYINTTLKPWITHHLPRRAGVSSFGIGGTNAHVILEEYKGPAAGSEEAEIWHILPLSAENQNALQTAKLSLIAYLEAHPELSLSDIAYTLQHRRQRFIYRAYIVAKRLNDRVLYHDGLLPEELAIDIKTGVMQWMAGADNTWPITHGHVVRLPGYPFCTQELSVTARAPSSSNTTASNETLAYEISKLLQDLLEMEKIIPEQSFDELGIDSLLTIDIALSIEEKLGYKVSTQDFYAYPTINKLAQHLQSQNCQFKKMHSSNLSVEIKRGHSNARTLFCIHPAGGTVSVFQDIAAALNNGYRVIGIRSWGWDGKSSPDDSIDKMAQRYLSEIQTIQEHGPYYLCGSSIGGTIALEIAKKLSDAGEETALLALLDSPASFHRDNHLVTPQTSEEIKAYISALCPSMAEGLKQLQQRDASIAEQFYKLWYCHASSLSKHFPSPCRQKITYFSACEKSAFLPKDFLSEWLAVAKAGLEVHTIDGNHLTIHTGAGAKQIADILNQKIASPDMYYVNNTETFTNLL